MNLNIKYINSNISKDFTKKKFDVITYEVLEHVDDVSITIEKISKLLKRWFVCWFYNKSNNNFLHNSDFFCRKYI